MQDYEFYDDYCEPSEADQFFEEITEKFKKMLGEKVTSEIEQLKSENAKLRTELDEVRAEKNRLRFELNGVNRTREELKQEVENEFYNTAIDEVFKSRIENIDLWFADLVNKQKPKCQYCNDDRRRIYEFPDGLVIDIGCPCGKGYSIYEPKTASIRTLTYCIKPSEYKSERKFYVKDWNLYKPHSLYDDYGWEDFKILQIFEEFDEESIEKIRGKLGYGERIGFKKQSECQKYCDWLNKKY